MLADFTQGLLSPGKQGRGAQGAEGLRTDRKSPQANLGVPHLLVIAVRSRGGTEDTRWRRWPSLAAYISINMSIVK